MIRFMKKKMMLKLIYEIFDFSCQGFLYTLAIWSLFFLRNNDSLIDLNKFFVLDIILSKSIKIKEISN